MDYWLGFCGRAFGVKLNPKNAIDEMNFLFGGTNMKGSNIYFTNGVEDGWQWAAMREVKDEDSTMKAHVVNCTDCGHCVDLYTESSKDASDLVRTRREIRANVATWLGVDANSINNQEKPIKTLKNLLNVVE